MQPSSGTTTFRLLNLPFELRTMIYEHLAPNTKVIDQESTYIFPGAPPPPDCEDPSQYWLTIIDRSKDLQPCEALQLTCRQIYQEIHGLLESRTILSILEYDPLAEIQWIRNHRSRIASAARVSIRVPETLDSKHYGCEDYLPYRLCLNPIFLYSFDFDQGIGAGFAYTLKRSNAYTSDDVQFNGCEILGKIDKHLRAFNTLLESSESAPWLRSVCLEVIVRLIWASTMRAGFDDDSEKAATETDPESCDYGRLLARYSNVRRETSA